MMLPILSFAIACGLCWRSPMLSAALGLSLCLIVLGAIKLLRYMGESAMKQSPFYTSRYWSDSEKDALETYALYWSRTKAARALGLALKCLAGLAITALADFRKN